MGVLHAFRLSLLLPRQHAVFQLNRLKTKSFLIYILVLHLIIAIPNGVQLISNSITRGEFGKESLLILFGYPVFIIFFGMTGISLFASTGLLIRTLTKRKLVYQLLWKMTVYALTYPIVLYPIFDLLAIPYRIMNFSLLLVFLVIFLKMILAYPKIRKSLVK